MQSFGFDLIISRRRPKASTEVSISFVKKIYGWSTESPDEQVLTMSADHDNDNAVGLDLNKPDS